MVNNYRMETLLVPQQIDSWLGYPRGRAKKMANASLIPHIVMPDGEIRFDRSVIKQWLRENTKEIARNCDGMKPVQPEPVKSGEGDV